MSSVVLRDKFPISQEDFLVHETTDLTTSILDLRRDKFPIFQKDFLTHEVTIHRLLRYSTQDETRSLSPKKTYSSMRWQHIDYHDTRHQEDIKFLIPKRNSSSTKWQPVDYHNTRPMKRYDLYFPRRNYHSRRQTNRQLRYSNNLLTSKEGTFRPRDARQVDYYGTRRNNSRQPMTSFMKRQPADRPSTKKKKVLYVKMSKVL